MHIVIFFYIYLYTSLFNCTANKTNGYLKNSFSFYREYKFALRGMWWSNSWSMDFASCTESGMARCLFEMCGMPAIFGRALHLLRTGWKNLLQARLRQVKKPFNLLLTTHWDIFRFGMPCILVLCIIKKKSFIYIQRISWYNNENGYSTEIIKDSNVSLYNQY